MSLHGIPIQVFELTDGYVVSMSYQKLKSKESVRLSHHAKTPEEIGARITEYLSAYNRRHDE